MKELLAAYGYLLMALEWISQQTWLLWPLGAAFVYMLLKPIEDAIERRTDELFELLTDIRSHLQKIEGTNEELLREMALASSYLRDINNATHGRPEGSGDL